MTISKGVRAEPVGSAAAPVRVRLRHVSRILFGIDLLVICAAMAVALTVSLVVLAPPRSLGDKPALYGTAVWVCLVWAAWLVGCDAYSVRLLGAGVEEFKAVALASMLACGTVAFISYITKEGVSRWFVSLTFVIGATLLLAMRYIARTRLHAERRRGHLMFRTVAVGAPEALNELQGTLGAASFAGFELIGLCVPNLALSESVSERLGLPVLGGVDDVHEVAAHVGAEVVMVAGQAFPSRSGLRHLGWQLEGTGIDLVVVPSMADIAGPRLHLRPIAGVPLMHLEPPQAEAATRWAKRAFDVVGALLLLVITAPLIGAATLAVFLTDGGPVIFRQQRVGRGGVAFTCYKIRTMVHNAETKLASLVGGPIEPLYKFEQDPRVTRVGAFLRRFSIDELPQLLNVLLGEMSLVGPRPQIEAEVATYDAYMQRRLLVRPGMTGLWQVSGRSALSWRETVTLDLYYVDNWSMSTDVVILAKTVRAVLARTGAM